MIERYDICEEWAHSGIVKAGDLYFLSYCVGNIGGTIEEQVNGAFDHMEKRLKQVGLTLENVVQMDCLFRDVWNIPVMEKVIRERFRGKYPARKSIQTNFAHVGGESGLLFQADAVACAEKPEICKDRTVTGSGQGRKGMIRGIHHISMKCGTQEEFEKVKDFYVRILGMSIDREWPDGVLIDSGAGMIEVFSNGAGDPGRGILRHVAFRTDNVDELVDRVKAAGYKVFVEPTDSVIRSDPEYPIRIAFCYGPLGEEVELFCER